MKYKKIVTHAGTHHADELLAIATIYYFLGCSLTYERTDHVTDTDLEDPGVIVLDTGRRFEPEKSNFDHHQDGNLPATNILVLEHFCKATDIKALLKKYLYSYVDSVDRGKIVEGKERESFDIPSLNAIIRNLNNVKMGFEKALQLVKTALSAAIATAEKAVESKERWKTLEKREYIAIQHDTEFIVGWRELAANEGILLLVSPNRRQEGSYQITSRDTEIIKIPAHEKQIFLHASGFIAAYPDFNSAVEHAIEFIGKSRGYSHKYI